MLKLSSKISIVLFTLLIYSGLLKWLSFWPVDTTILFASLSLIFLLFNRLKFPVGYSKYIMTFFLFSIWIFLSMTYSSSNQYLYVKGTNYILIIYSFLYLFLIIKDKNHIVFFLNCQLLVGLIISFIILYLYFQGGGDLYDTYHIFMEYGNPLGIPDPLALGVPVGSSIIIALYKNRLIYKFFIFFMFLALILLSGRGPFLGLFFILLLFLYFRLNFSRRFLFRTILFSSLIFFNFNTISQWSGLDRLTSRFAISLNTTDDNHSVIIRLNQIVTSKNIFVKSPLIGVGLGAYSKETSGIDQRGYPHNIFLEILTEQGLIGLILFLILLYPIFFKMLPFLARHTDPIYFSIAGVFVFEIFNASKSSSIIEDRFLFSLIALCILSYKYSQNDNLILNKN
tara:strand:- start:3454 stop:4644 length:1191 start_codon:yes stop_codon:yes gene_type:complete